MESLIKIEGIEYVIRDYSFGEELDISTNSLSLKKEGGEIVPKVDSKTMQIQMIIKALQRWTFRGVAEDGSLKTNGAILPINGDSIQQLPRRHGVVVLDKVRDLTSVDEETVKN